MISPQRRRTRALRASAAAVAGALATAALAAPASAVPTQPAPTRGPAAVDPPSTEAFRAHLLRKIETKIVRVRAAERVLVSVAGTIPNEPGTIAWGVGQYQQVAGRQVDAELRLLRGWQRAVSESDDPLLLARIADRVATHHPVAALAAEARTLVGYRDSIHDLDALEVTVQAALDEVGTVTDRVAARLEATGDDAGAAHDVEDAFHTALVTSATPAYDREVALRPRVQSLTRKRLAVRGYATDADALTGQLTRAHRSSDQLQFKVADLKMNAYDDLLALLPATSA